MNYSLNLELAFRLSAAELPTIETEYHRLWQFASTLQVAGFPIDG
ncbi:hypothetical protein [Paraburkholderia caledonica]|uniref:Uncharacterized protein n=1 Tax=Paraburkholderia caledonica TaxID=134536 RepID=A0AB73IRA1_9BURK|nr:hypothetical protein [Paraburkholderia caledonica]